jgi:addiction module HigA family antidote
MANLSKSPGALLKSLLDQFHLNPNSLGTAISLGSGTVRNILGDKSSITAPVALRLAKYFGVPVDTWMDLQNKFDLAAAQKDPELAGILKNIVKAKLPSAEAVAKKASAAAKKAVAQKLASKKKTLVSKTKAIASKLKLK